MDGWMDELMDGWLNGLDVCMYVCMYVCVHACIDVCMHVRMYVCRCCKIQQSVQVCISKCVFQSAETKNYQACMLPGVAGVPFVLYILGKWHLTVCVLIFLCVTRN